jgi:hypothetical protein
LLRWSSKDVIVWAKSVYMAHRKWRVLRRRAENLPTRLPTWHTTDQTSSRKVYREQL